MQSTKENPKSLTNLSELQKEIIESVRSGKSLLGKDGALTPLIKQALEAALEGEIEAHMTSNEEDNRRNGKMKKLVNGESGTFELETPRDRNGSFEPQIVKKRQTVITEELDNKILALYALGAGYKDISKHMADLYDYEVSPATITSVPDKLKFCITSWVLIKKVTRIF
jgi:putative transposase